METWIHYKHMSPSSELVWLQCLSTHQLVTDLFTQLNHLESPFPPILQPIFPHVSPLKLFTYLGNTMCQKINSLNKFTGHPL